MTRPRVFITQPIADSALARLRKIANVTMNKGFEPYSRQEEAHRRRQANRHPVFAAARHHRS
jgi:hypothetical protein